MPTCVDSIVTQGPVRIMSVIEAELLASAVLGHLTAAKALFSVTFTTVYLHSNHLNCLKAPLLGYIDEAQHFLPC